MLARFSFSLFLMISLTLSRSAAQQIESTTLGGYGELHYNEPTGTAKGQLDFHRFVIYLSHNFNNNLSFISEVELEHTVIEAGEPEGGELSIEQAYIDYRFFDTFGFRAGILLAPVGLINLLHEPPTFNGVERPMVDRVIIPTTWREAGAGIYGSLAEDISCMLYIVAGLDAAGFDVSSGIRGGRQNAFESNPANPSLTGAIGYSPAPGLHVGGSFFFGSAHADHDSIGSPHVGLWSADVRYNLNALTFRAVGALGTISDAEAINMRFQQNVADRFYGYYVEGAYDILWLLAPDSEQILDIFARYEKHNTQAKTTGFTPMMQYNRNDIVLGLSYKPTYNTVFKFDYTFMNNALNTEAYPNSQQLNLGVGYFFN